MKNFVLGLVLSISTLVSTTALADFTEGDIFDFSMITGGAPGCVYVNEIWADTSFPYLENQIVKTVKLFYAVGSLDQVTSQSKNTAYNVEGDLLEGPQETCGFEPGSEVFFKAGLSANDGKILYLTPNDKFNSSQHSVIVP